MQFLYDIYYNIVYILLCILIKLKVLGVLLIILKKIIYKKNEM